MVKLEYHNYNLNSKCSDDKKRLRDFLNDKKDTSMIILSQTWFQTCTKINQKSLSLYACFARAGRSLFLCPV